MPQPGLPLNNRWCPPAAATSNARAVVAASAEGYAFPTNLDRDQPIGGLAPETQAQLVWRALQEDWSPEALDAELTAQGARHAAAP